MVSAFDTLALDFLYACLISLLVSIPVWLLVASAARRSTAVTSSRAVWLLAQCVIFAALAVALAPQRSLLSVLPPIEVSRSAPAANGPPVLADALAGDEAIPPLPELSWRDLVARAWLLLYAGGVLVAAGRVLAGRRALGALLADARLLSTDELAAHGAFAAPATRPLPVWETPAAVSPMLVGLCQPCLLLPRHLRDFPLSQQQLIVAHELTHWQRRDPLWLHVSIVLQLALWFNPLLRRLARGLSVAQELGCDRQVLRGRPQSERRHYAAALVAQLKLQSVPGALAFGDDHHSSLAGRIRLIRMARPGRFQQTLKVAMALSLSAVLAASAMLQPAFAWRSDALPSPGVTVGAAPAWQAPLAQARVSSFFGVPRKNLPAGHGGIDFAASTGTPVLASADGVVVQSTDLYEGGAKYGKVIVIAHADQTRSVYAHLDQRAVLAGAAVSAGQKIGQSGATGKVTGPHLHLEVFQDGRRIDPARMIAGLDQRAFPKALAERAAAGLR